MTWCLRIEIPGRLLSENAGNRNVSADERAAVLARTGKRMKGRKLTPAAAQWKTEVLQTVQTVMAAYRVREPMWRDDVPLAWRRVFPCRIVLDFAIHDEWETKAGQPQRRDLNLKLLQDAVCAGLGLDDCYVYEMHAHKATLCDGKPMMIVTVTPWKRGLAIRRSQP